MIEETGTIVACKGKYAEVETEPQSCGNCSASGACGTSLISKVFGRRRSHIRVLNSLDLHAGDGVVIGLSEQALVKASVTLYLLPLVALLLGAICGQFFSEWIGADVELGSIAGGLLGLLVALIWLKALSGRLNKTVYQAVMVRRRFSNTVMIERPDYPQS